MGKSSAYRDQWQFHFNDWMDNGTFHGYEEDMEKRPEIKENSPVSQPSVRANPNNRSSLMTTGRFDQFNDEFDGNFNLHSYDHGEHHSIQDDEKSSGVDEYRDDDPYKINGPNTAV